MTKISDERLLEIRSEYADMADTLTGAFQDGPGVASAFYMSCSLSEVAEMAAELQTLRQLDKEQEGGHIQRGVSQSSPQPAGVRVKGLDRYDMYANHDGERAWPSPELAAQGEWVKFVDLPTLETQEEEAVAVWIEREALDQLLRHKTATATVSSGLLSKPFGEKIPLFAHSTPVQKEEEGQTVSDEWLRDTAMNVMLASEVDEAARILTAALVKP